MSTCKTCKGHGLHPFLRPGTDKLLFTEDECQVCGGKGYLEGGRTYAVAVFRNGIRTASVNVIARTAPEALARAADLVDSSLKFSGSPQVMQRDDALGMEVIEI